MRVRPATAEPDSRLVERARTDARAFGVLYARYVDRVYAYTFHRVGSVEDAEDLTSRAFFHALAALDTYRDQGAPFSAWRFRIAHNLVATWHRDRRRHPLVGLDQVAWPASAEYGGRVPDGLDDPTMWRAIRRLDPDRQALLVLKFADGLSNAEIALVLGRSESGVKSLYHRTLVDLRTMMGAERKGAEWALPHVELEGGSPGAR